MKLYIAKLGSESDEESILSTMCVKYDAKSSILPVWYSPEHAHVEVPRFTPGEYRIQELDWNEYSELAKQHQKLGINLFMHIREEGIAENMDEETSD